MGRRPRVTEAAPVEASETDPDIAGGVRQRVMLALYALFVPLAFPHALPGGGVFDLGVVATWWVPMWLALGLVGRPAKSAAAAAFVASVAGHVLLFSWFFVVTVVYGHMPAALGIASPLVPALYVSAFTALFAAGWSALSEGAGSGTGRTAAAVFGGAALWVALDWARAHFLGGFPWGTLGYGLHQDLPLLVWTRWTGVYGLSFLAAAVGLSLALFWRRRDGASRAVLVGTLGAVAVLHGLGWAFPPSGAADGAGPFVRVAAIQGNVDQGQKWDEGRRRAILDKYLARSAAAANDGAEWIVWPETAVPGLLEFDAEIADPIRRFSTLNPAVLFVGGMGYDADPEGLRRGDFFDSAFVVDAEGRFLDRYDKTKLVPFGEFVPLRALLGRVFKALATGLSNTDVRAGERPRKVRTPARVAGRDGPSDLPFEAALPICYELIFPHTVRLFAADGADVLLAMTNDAWYGRTGAPHQFLAMTAMRAAENGLYVVRSANTGISAIIDDRGRVLDQSELFEDATVLGEIPISRGGPRTFYARYGDVFAGACGFLAVGTWIGSRRSARDRLKDQAGAPPER